MEKFLITCAYFPSFTALYFSINNARVHKREIISCGNVWGYRSLFRQSIITEIRRELESSRLKKYSRNKPQNSRANSIIFSRTSTAEKYIKKSSFTYSGKLHTADNIMCQMSFFAERDIFVLIFVFSEDQNSLYYSKK